MIRANSEDFRIIIGYGTKAVLRGTVLFCNKLIIQLYTEAQLCSEQHMPKPPYLEKSFLYYYVDCIRLSFCLLELNGEGNIFRQQGNVV